MADSPDRPNPYIRELWPVRILNRRLGQFGRVNPELITLFEQYRQAHPSQRPGGSYVSPDNFSQQIDNPALQTLEKFILDNVFAVACECNRAYWQKGMSFDVRLTGLWFQIANGFGFHDVHVHGNCSWSGVYYVQSGSASRSAADIGPNGMPNGVTRFYGPRMEYQAAGHGDRGNLYLHDYTYDSYPEDGKLVVFPSYLKHMALPYQGEKDRIIVSFHAVVDTDTELRYNYAFS